MGEDHPLRERDVRAAWHEGCTGVPDARPGTDLDLQVHRSVTSTNDVVADDPRPWRVVVAEHQSAGRGRRGRQWESPPGAGLAMTVVLPAPPPGTDAGAVLGWYPLAAGLALADAVVEVTGVDARLKWPNDLLVPVPDQVGGGLRWGEWGKAAGLLAERAHGAPVVVLGAGLNVRSGRGNPGTSLEDAGAHLGHHTPPRLVAGYLLRLRHAISGLLADGATSGLRAGYETRCHTLGRRVRVHRPDGTSLDGVATGLGVQGALHVRDVDGAVHEIHAGDVEHLRPA